MKLDIHINKSDGEEFRKDLRILISIDVHVAPDVDSPLAWRAHATSTDWDLDAVAKAIHPVTAALFASDALLKKAGKLVPVQFEDGTPGVMPLSHLQKVEYD